MKALMTAKEAAAALLLAPQTLAKYRSTGTPAIPFVKIGRRVCYAREDIERFIASRTRMSTSDPGPDTNNDGAL